MLAAACSATDDVTLEIADADGDCPADVLRLVKTLSIEAVATAGRCRLAQECAFNVNAGSVADLAAALRASSVLLELPADDAQVLVLNGRPTRDCFPRDDGSNRPVVCASASFSQARDGALVLELQHDTDASRCLESIMLCP